MSKWFGVKLILVTLLSIVPLSISALEDSYPFAWEGIHILPMKELNVPIIVKKAMMANQQQMEARGYVESDDNEAEFLLNMDGRAKRSNVGWRGRKEIFYYPSVGNCAYSQREIISIELSRESIKYLVGGKATSILVEGNVRNGFLYQVSWYVGEVMKTVECAHRVYDKRILERVVRVANGIA